MRKNDEVTFEIDKSTNHGYVSVTLIAKPPIQTVIEALIDNGCVIWVRYPPPVLDDGSIVIQDTLFHHALNAFLSEVEDIRRKQIGQE